MWVFLSNRINGFDSRPRCSLTVSFRFGLHLFGAESIPQTPVTAIQRQLLEGLAPAIITFFDMTLVPFDR
jgi:hypothetical protein